jgi:translation initiation factor RLI1
MNRFLASLEITFRRDPTSEGVVAVEDYTAGQHHTEHYQTQVF